MNQNQSIHSFGIGVWPRKLLTCTAFCIASSAFLFAQQTNIQIFPLNNAKNVNPDTHLVLTFQDEPVLGNRGQIRVYDASNNQLVDKLDVSIPAGPTKAVDHGANVPPYTSVPYSYVSDNFTNANTKPGTPSGLAVANSDTFQLNIIGRFTDAFHFYPVIIRNRTATITLHNNLLAYNKTYYVQIDSTVLSLKNKPFKGFIGKSWTFTTKEKAPLASSRKLIVNADGSGDFNTVQAAVDFIPDFNKKRTTIFIKNGIYEEIVYFRNKTNIDFVGESRDKTVVCYANNEVFNPHPSNISTNEVAGTFPSRRAAFAADNCSGLRFSNFTIKTTAKGQAEGLLIMGKENQLSGMTIVGSGDALQANGSAYFDKCTIIGDGDTFLSRGPAFFNQCEFESYGAFMWVRNTAANHGAVLLNCKLKALGSGETEIARAPDNKGKSYPNCEVVLINCSLSGISPVGWGPVGNETANIHYWEYNSKNLNTGTPIDASQRHPASRQLSAPKDAQLIKNYSTPAFVLNGWKP